MFTPLPRTTRVKKAISFLCNISIPSVVVFLHILVQPGTIWAGSLDKKERVTLSPV